MCDASQLPPDRLVLSITSMVAFKHESRIRAAATKLGAAVGGNNISFRVSKNVEKGMVLPFVPLTMTFTDVHYYVDVPAVSFWTALYSQSDCVLMLRNKSKEKKRLHLSALT